MPLFVILPHQRNKESQISIHVKRTSFLQDLGIHNQFQQPRYSSFASYPSSRSFQSVCYVLPMFFPVKYPQVNIVSIRQVNLHPNMQICISLVKLAADLIMSLCFNLNKVHWIAVTVCIFPPGFRQRKKAQVSWCQQKQQAE